MQGADKINDEREVGFDESFETRWSRIGRSGCVVLVELTDGTPVIVCERGERHRDRMRNLRMLASDVIGAARQKSLMRLQQIRHAVVERDGRIPITPEEDG